jgi:hypothetical protein
VNLVEIKKATEELTDYSTEKGAIITHTPLEYGYLCEQCKEKEPLEEGE